MGSILESFFSASISITGRSLSATLVKVVIVAQQSLPRADVKQRPPPLRLGPGDVDLDVSFAASAERRVTEEATGLLVSF